MRYQPKHFCGFPFGELAPQYGFYEDIWLKPQEYTLEIWAVAIAFLIIFASTAFLPQRRQSKPQ